MSKESDEIYADIQKIREDWKMICNDHALLDKVEFLELMHSHILTLDDHSERLKKHKSIHELIYHILHTPAGAPAVTEKTLFESAEEFTLADAKNSSLHIFLQKSLTSSDESDNYLFNSLSILEEQLKKAS